MIRPLALSHQVWHTASQIQRAASLGCPWNNLPRHRNPDTPEYDPTVADAASLDVHLAACHACNYVSETSCEIGNILLDRALLTETLIGSDCAFFA